MLVETLLFLWLSPGVLFTLPSTGPEWFNTDTTSVYAVLVHAVLFGICLLFLGGGSKSREGFQTEPRTWPPRIGSANKRALEKRAAELKEILGA
jgi:hypothetical protein